MLVLVQYAKADGQILGVWQADPATSLTAQAQEGSDTLAYALTETDLAVEDILKGSVWHDGALVTKTRGKLQAEPVTFAADGTSECYVTIEPFVPCTLLVDGQPLALTAADPIAVLTSDSPHRFLIQLQLSAQMQAADLTVEAT